MARRPRNNFYWLTVIVPAAIEIPPPGPEDASYWTMTVFEFEGGVAPPPGAGL